MNLDTAIDTLLSPIADKISGIIFSSVTIHGVKIEFLVALLMIAAFYFTVRTRFIGIWGFKHALELITKNYEHKDIRVKKKRGEVSSFQALTATISASAGIGNVAGSAAAVSIGGPGVIFWMIMAGFFSMALKFAEVLLGLKFRKINPDGTTDGGPMYYIKNGLSKKWHFLAVFYAVFGVLTVFGTGNATQVNTIVSSVNTALMNFNILKGEPSSNVNLIFGIFIAALVAMVLLGGIKRIGQVSEKLVPFMAVLYVILALGVIILNIQRVPGVFAQIVSGAFTPRAATGGIIGSMFLSMKKGVSRGIFSNEAGLGTGSIAHACADTRKPVKQGFFGIFEVFVDTIVICTLTALVILCSGVPVGYGEAAGAELTISGFTSVYGGWVSIFTAVAMCCFAFSTIIGWGLYGTRCIEFLFGTRANKPFMILYALVAIVGATMNLGLMWNIAETFNGLMVIPNLIAVFLLSGVVVKLVKEYFEGEGKTK